MSKRLEAQVSVVLWRPSCVRRVLLLVVVACLLATAPAQAQNRNGGEIRGTVTDSSSAVVPGVQIAIENVLTGVVTNFVSDSHGVYDAPTLTPGSYSVTFTVQGFKKLVKTNIALHVETITVDATLQVGASTQQITVTTGPELVQTETSDKRSTLTEQNVVELPTVGLNWYDLNALQPGTNPGSPTTTGFGGFAGGQGVGLNGNGGFLQSWQIDGGESSMAMNPDFLEAPIDAIGEINFKTNNFSAEYANGTAIFSVITKSGTNRFHGTLYEFNQNDAYDAANYFVNSVGATKPTVRWNEWGGNLGGPIKKEKIFFFFNFQRNPVASHATGFYNYPTAAMREGNFAGLPTIYDPNTTTQLPDGSYSRTPFNQNAIPGDRIDSAAKNVQAYYPMPNVTGAGVVNNYFYDIFVPQTTSYYNGKLDFNLSQKNRLNFSTAQVALSNLTGYSGYSPIAPIDEIHGNIHEWQFQLSDVWTLSPNTVNEFRISWSRENGVWAGAEAGKGWGQKLGIPNLTADYFPAISVEGTASPSAIGWSFKDAVDTSSKPVISDDVTLVRGRHILKFGGEFDMYRGANCWSCQWPGAYDFNGIFTADPSNPTGTGMGYSDFLLGLPDNWSDSWTPTTGSRQHTIQAFAQDDFKVTPRLTLNLGVRWFAPSGWGEEHNRWGDFDPHLNNPATGTPGAVIYGGQGRSSIQQTHWNGFGPRLGFAWSPRNNWSVRGSYAIIDTSVDLSGNQAGMGLGISVNGYQASTDNLTPFTQLSQGHAPPPVPTFPPTADFYNGGGISYLPYRFPLTYVQQWTLNVQHQFRGGMMLEVGYTGTHDNHIVETSDLNQVPTAAIAQYGAIGVDMQPYRPYPQFQGISYQASSGHSSYNSLQVTFKKSFGHGLWITSNYTYSHALDTGTLEGYYAASLLQISDNTRANYGNSDIDVRHLWNGGFTYELPFGKGKYFLNRGGVLNGIVGGWRVSNLWVMNSGQPFNVYWGSANLSLSLANNWLPNRVCDGSLGNAATVNQWFNPACFVQAQPGTFGNAGRNILSGPGFVNMNSSIAKAFRLSFLGEAGKLDLRLDVTDVLNHPNFGATNGYVTPPPTAAGSITSALTNRTAQIGARLSF